MILRNSFYRFLGTIAPAYAPTRKNVLRVLAYHTVPDPGAYERQLRYLRDHYAVVSLDDLLSHHHGGTPLPPRALLITFDDGDRTVYEHGLPLHRQYGLPAVLFVITGLIGTEEPFWWKKIELHYAATGRPTTEARQKINELKTVTDGVRREFLATLPDYRQAQLRPKELGELAQAGIAIANHTVTHPLIDRCSEDRMGQEVGRAADYLEGVDGAYPKVFAYPNGNANAVTEDILRREGIELAFLFDHRLTSLPLRNPLRLSRLRANTDDALPEFSAKVSGLHSLIYHRGRS
jgi:peptidoglycan/xylan/chitin deacetylase (PgdA/CDA1 family)